MSGEPIVTVVGTMGGDTELRFTPSGAAVASFSLAQTPRVKDKSSDEWRDGETIWFRCTVWRQPAENVAESLTKGTRVIVVGRLTQKTFTTKEGVERTGLEIQVDEIGPSLQYATAKVNKLGRSSASSSDDSWAASSDSAPF
jgi:single-strand DNA-binding protein